MNFFKSRARALSDTSIASSVVEPGTMNRRRFGLTAAAALATPLVLQGCATANEVRSTRNAQPSGRKATHSVTVDNIQIDTGNFRKRGIGYNKSQTPTILRFTEGDEVTISVTNNLREWTSIHWHGLILPFRQDGVPGISFKGIAPGSTFTYRFPIVQAGTYWFHSHSGFQEPDGAYGAIVIEPREGERYKTQRDYVVQFADKHPHPGARIARNLKLSSDYYNRSQRTLEDLIRDSRATSFKAALENRGMWGRMRMMPTDIEDVQGFTPLINGESTSQNWTGLFRPGEKVRLRFINSSAMTYFDVRVPGLKMTVVEADGNPVKPVTVDELRIAVSETYDVIVQPRENKAYSIIGESMGRTALVRGTLSPREGYAGPVPRLRPKPLLTMADMSGMSGMMGGMDHSGMDMGRVSTQGTMEPMDHSKMDHSQMTATDEPPMDGMDHSKMDHSTMKGMDKPKMEGMDHSKMKGMKKSKKKADHSNMKSMDHSKMTGMNHSNMKDSNMQGMDHSAMQGMDHSGMDMSGPMKAGGNNDFYAKGSGLTPTAYNGGKFLSYNDLRAAKPLYKHRPPSRTIVLRLTGNMERYMWSINDVKYDDAEPIVLKYGERVRLRFVNETMMAHPMHLHGMWSIIDTGKGRYNPIKHAVNVNPGTIVDAEVEVDAPGQWAFHCHLSYHAQLGMFRKVVVKT